jgi:hypothetical protein
VLERLGREEVFDNAAEAWNILVECDTEVGLGLNEWLVKCGNTSCRYVLCTYVCAHLCLGFVFSFFGFVCADVCKCLSGLVRTGRI